MILHYFKKKENIEKEKANSIYASILKKSNVFLNNNSFFISKNYNSSFELLSFFLILYIKLNISYNFKNFKKINEYLITLFISDLDESLRSKGIGDMSIGKYVKSYVKKFYFRLKKFPDLNNINPIILEEYLVLFELIQENEIRIASQKLFEEYKKIEFSYIEIK